MTKEEAIKIIKKNMPSKKSLPVYEALETLIPELTESEDERIRKELVNFIKRNSATPFALYDKFTPEQYITYLEKQKAEEISTRLNGVMQEYVKAGRNENENEQEHRLKSYKLFWDSLEDSEFFKQKENPKSAKSISLDCTSDAKCENRWHKVEDSLPDNGRLVLANDYLGNTLLARYDGEGNWEVSVYDNEDYYCRNTITKWCEIPSKKQKEQKPVDDKAFEEWVDDWWKHNKVNNPDSYDKGDEIQFDERGFKNICCRIRNMFAEQRPVEQSREDDHVIGFVYDLLNEIEWKDNWVMNKDECLRLLNNYSPQKPAELDEYTTINLDRALQIIKKAKGTLQGYQSDDGIYECDKAIECLEHFLYRGLEIEKTAEWRDEDKHNLNSVINLVHATTDGAWGSVIGDYIENWLKNLPERFNLQPKPEWSEEDDMLMDELESYILYDKEFNDEQKSWRIKRLKSLRPQPQKLEDWTEEDERKYQCDIKMGYSNGYT